MFFFVSLFFIFLITFLFVSLPNEFNFFFFSSLFYTQLLFFSAVLLTQFFILFFIFLFSHAHSFIFSFLHSLPSSLFSFESSGSTIHFTHLFIFTHYFHFLFLNSGFVFFYMDLFHHEYVNISFRIFLTFPFSFSERQSEFLILPSKKKKKKKYCLTALKHFLSELIILHKKKFLYIENYYIWNILKSLVFK